MRINNSSRWTILPAHLDLAHIALDYLQVDVPRGAISALVSARRNQLTVVYAPRSIAHKMAVRYRS